MTDDSRRQSPPHIFTVDLEEYFQVHVFEGIIQRAEWSVFPSRVERATDALLKLLDDFDGRATFFVLGWVAERHPNLIRRIDGLGHEIASHGWWHRRVTELGPEMFRDDAGDTKALLEDLVGKPVVGFRAPSFSLIPGTEWVFDVLVELGYQYDSSIFPIRRSGYGYPGAPTEPHIVNGSSGSLLELPMTTLGWSVARLPAAGGAYFRHLPYGWTRRALEQMQSRNVSGVFYIHPWELDPHQPRIPVSPVSRLRHYRGLEQTARRLQRLLTDFSFTSVADHYGLRGTMDVPRSLEDLPTVDHVT